MVSNDKRVHANNLSCGIRALQSMFSWLHISSAHYLKIVNKRQGEQSWIIKVVLPFQKSLNFQYVFRPA